MPQMIINCTDEEHRDFLEIARQCKTSPSALGQHSMRQIIATVRAGEWPVVATDDGARTIKLKPSQPPQDEQIETVKNYAPDYLKGRVLPSISFNCSDDLKDAFHKLARDSKTSVTALGQLAVRQLVAAAQAGAKPMIVKSDGKNAPQFVRCSSIGPKGELSWSIPD